MAFFIILLLVSYSIVSLAALSNYQLKNLEFNIIKADSKSVYLVVDGHRYNILNPETVSALGYDFSQLTYVTEQVLDEIPLGGQESDVYNPSIFDDFLKQMRLKQTKWAAYESDEAAKFHLRALSKRRVLIVTVDNRKLDSNKTNNFLHSSYYSPTLAINFKYATRHDYDFIAIRCNSTGILQDIQQKYNLTIDDIRRQEILMEPSNDPLALDKDRLTTFNVKLKQARASPWAKLPALALILDLLERDESVSNVTSYDMVWYLDSDLAINPELHKKSLPDMLVHMTHNLVAGLPLSETSILFFSNAPYAAIPCTGSIVFFPGFGLARDLVTEWWDHDFAVKNFHHEYEQASLWDMLKSHHNITEHYSYSHSLKQFPPCEGQFLCHLGHPWSNVRMKVSENKLSHNEHSTHWLFHNFCEPIQF